MSSITLSRDGTSATISSALEVQRRVGRPRAELRPTPSADAPNYGDQDRGASDVFVISGQFTSASASTDAQTLREDVVRSPLGRDALTLTFDNSLYGLGSYDVAPSGSRALRESFVAGQDASSWVYVDDLELRVVTAL